MTPALADLLQLQGTELVAFVGGGGKSTMALTLVRELAAGGGPVVLTTTTKMGSDQVPAWTTVAATTTDAIRALRRGSSVFLAATIDPPKVIGVPPEVVDEVFSIGGTPVVAEADGARRRPFKAPGPAEPVVPSLATLVVSVVGIDAVGRKIGDVCHRPEQITALTGRGPDATVRPEDVATVMAHPDGGGKHVPAAARRIVAVTKVTPADQPTVAAIRSALDGLTVVEVPSVVA